MRAIGVLAAAAAAAGAGCGSEPPPRAAEPAASPPARVAPPGRVVPVGPMPEGLAADPRTGLVAVGLRNPDRLALVDGATGRVTRRVALPESPRHLALARPGGPVLVPAERADDLLEVGLPDGRLRRRSAAGAFPHDAATGAGRIFVTAERGNRLTVLGPGRRSASARTATQPGGVTAWGDVVAVVAVRDRVIETFDARTLRRTGLDTAGAGPTHAVAGPDGRVYVIDTQGDAVLAYRVRPSLAFIGRVALPGAPYGVALDSRRGRLWVTLTETNRLAELRFTRRAPRLVGLHRTVRQPNSVAVDSRRGTVYVASRTDGTLHLLRAGDVR